MSRKDGSETEKMRRRMSNQGFTLVELLVAMVISLVVMSAVYSTYHSQQESYIVQEQVAAMQQNLRAALDTMEREIRMAGYDPNNSGNFAIRDVSYDANGRVLTFDVDLDEDGILETGETITYSIFDHGPDGDFDLGRNEGGGQQLLAENIQALGFAYAFDSDANGELDFVDKNGNGQRDANEPVIWAIDEDGDNWLDLNLDTNDDGVIDENDDKDGDGLIDGKALGALIPISAVRAVKIWLLARTERSMRGFTDPNTYVVEDIVLTPMGAFRRRLLTANVRCRNLSL